MALTVALPARPLLSPHAHARRHFRDEKTPSSVIMVFDSQSGGVVEVGEAAWTILRQMDGTRDLEGVRMAAEKEGVARSLASIRTLLAPLVEAGLVVAHDAARRSETEASGTLAPTDQTTVKSDLPVVAIADFTMRCDGRGSCCRLYGTVLFSPLEEAQARAQLPLLRLAGNRPKDVFTPVAGVDPDGPRSAAFSAGRCVYLHDDGRCRIHASGGAGAKPLGCNLFPAVFVDDGTELRVSVAPECACVLRSAAADSSLDGESVDLVPAVVRRRADLDPAVVVDVVSDEVVGWGSGAAVPKAAYLEWSAAFADGVVDSQHLIQLLWLAAETFPSSGGRGAPSVATQMVPWLDALSVRAFRQVAEDAAWRETGDLACQASRWIAQAALTLTDSRVLAAVVARPTSEAERFYVRALTFGHAFAMGRPVVTQLRDRAVRIAVARALSLSFTDEERADAVTEQPLALVEAMLRGHGLSDYVEAIEPKTV